jgi:CDP-glucose 4,6-dehydratase
VRSIVVVTSDMCYRNDDGQPCKEEDALGGHDPYSQSKAACELAAAAYRDAFFTPKGVGLATGRAGNVIGGGDWAKDRLIPDILKAQAEGRVPQLRNPESVRPWQHVLEPLSGYLRLAEALHGDPKAYAGGWNFGPSREDEKPVKWIAERMASLAGRSGGAWEPQPGQHPHEAEALRLDSSKARAKLGWMPTWGLDQALEAIVAWDQAYRSKQDLRALCLAQIRAHL